MSFQPSVKITQLLKSSASFTLQDATPTFVAPDINPNGYGAPGAPANFAGVDHAIVQVQYTGEDPVMVPQSAIAGNLTDGLVAGYFMRDGVHTVDVLFGVKSDPAKEKWTGSGTSLKLEILSGTNSIADVLTGLAFINDPSNGAVLKLKQVNPFSGYFDLYQPLQVAIPDGSNFIYKYYVASVKILVLNQGEGQIIKDISTMAISNCGCDATTSKKLMDRILLKLAAQTAFNCKNYAKAHYAATLLSQSGSTNYCASC